MDRREEQHRFYSTVSAGGYDFSKELGRYQFGDVSVGPYSLNRGTCTAGCAEGSAIVPFETARDGIEGTLLPTTLRRSAPVIDITRPLAGHYFDTHRGICFDAYLGVGQRLLDEAHPRIQEMLMSLLAYRAILRRESTTNDILVADGSSGIITPQILGSLLTNLAARAFPENGSYSIYLCSSGAEAIEASMKIACRFIHTRMVDVYGSDIEARVMSEFGIRQNMDLDHPEDRQVVYENYPFFFISVRRAFHGRTLGALSLSSVRPVNKRGFPAVSGIRRIDLNGTTDALFRLLDIRSLPEILNSPGGIRGVLDRGLIPRELVAGFVVEPFQGEGGYRIADRVWLQSAIDTCKTYDIAVIADEIQTFARTGKVFVSEHFGIAPDIVAISKSSVSRRLLGL